LRNRIENIGSFLAHQHHNGRGPQHEFAIHDHQFRLEAAHQLEQSKVIHEVIKNTKNSNDIVGFDLPNRGFHPVVQIAHTQFNLIAPCSVRIIGELVHHLLAAFNPDDRRSTCPRKGITPAPVMGRQIKNFGT